MKSQHSENSVLCGKDEFIAILEGVLKSSDREYIFTEISNVRDNIGKFKFLSSDLQEIVRDDIEQILSSRTAERAKYYIKRLRREITEVEYAPNSSINIRLWKGYDSVLTDSLWLLDRRVKNDVQSAWYWGNFVPQIPYQLMMRYTKENDWILDPFCGSGTTLYEAHRLRRNAIGIDINPHTVSEVKKRLGKLEETNNTILAFNGDSLEVNYKEIMEKLGIDSFSLAILHPPYHDIIKFTEFSGDLSNASSLDSFLDKFSIMAGKARNILSDKGTLGLVIGDRYRNGEVVPLGFRTMEAVLKQGFKLRGIIVKDIDNTRAKRSSTNLWRYRALKSGMFVFKHEYVFVFQKT